MKRRTYIIGSMLIMAYWLTPCELKADVIIDGFTTDQLVSVFGPPAGPMSASDSTLAPEAIGGERDILLNRTSANSGFADVDANLTNPGHLSMQNSSGTTSTALIVYDGTDGDPTSIDFSGLSSLDLTQGGLNSEFDGGSVSDLGGDVTITVYTDASNFSTFTFPVPTDPTPSPGTMVPFSIPFASFASAGPSGGADFSNVGAISLLVDGNAPQTDILLSPLSTVPGAGTTTTTGTTTTGGTTGGGVIPEPSSIALLGLGVTSLFGYSWRRRRSAK